MEMHRAQSVLPRAWPLLWVSAMLLSCGGGGGDSTPPPPPPPIGPTPNETVVSTATPMAVGCGIFGASVLHVNAEVEPFVAISPINPDHLVGAFQQDRAASGGARGLVSAVSFDGGRSWARTLQPMSRCGGAPAGGPGDHDRATDPWVDIGPDGTVHLMGLAFSGAIHTAGSSNQMLASRSTDGGRSWSAPQVLQSDGATQFNDKNTITADPTDARYVYAVWDRLDVDGNGPTLMARSADNGASWEPARTIYAPRVSGGVSQTIGNRIVVLPDGAERGTLVNVFTQIDTVDKVSAATVRVMRSADKGQTWSAPVTVAEHRSVGTRDPDSSTRVRDGGIVPTVATGPGGSLWVAWQDARFSGGVRDAIALSRSSDGGRSWSAPVAVNADATVAAFTPTLHVRADGRIGLMYYDLRSNTTAPTLLADLWLASSRDGVSWSETALRRGFDMNFAPSATGGVFLGDYHGLVSSGATFLPFVALPNADANNRTDVVAMRLDVAAAAREQPQAQREHLARASVPAVADDAAFRRARSDAIRRAMQWRIPAWGSPRER